MSFFFGDEFGALAAFGGDAVAAVLCAGVRAPRHHHIAISAGFVAGRYWQLTGGLGQRREHAGAAGFGGVGVPGRRGQHYGAVGQLLLDPATRPGVERLDQMMSATT